LRRLRARLGRLRRRSLLRLLRLHPNLRLARLRPRLRLGLWSRFRRALLGLRPGLRRLHPLLRQRLRRPILLRTLLLQLACAGTGTLRRPVVLCTFLLQLACAGTGTLRRPVVLCTFLLQLACAGTGTLRRPILLRALLLKLPRSRSAGLRRPRDGALGARRILTRLSLRTGRRPGARLPALAQFPLLLGGRLAGRRRNGLRPLLPRRPTGRTALLPWRDRNGTAVGARLGSAAFAEFPLLLGGRLAGRRRNGLRPLLPRRRTRPSAPLARGCRCGTTRLPRRCRDRAFGPAWLRASIAHFALHLGR